MKNEHKLPHCIALLLIFIMTSALAARADTVKGNVSDETGEPLIGVTVMAVGSKGESSPILTEIMRSKFPT